MNRPLWRRWAIAVIAFTAVSVSIAIWYGSVHRPELTLPDGRGVSLIQTTFGTQHELEQGSLAARLIARVAGKARAQRFGYRSIVQTTPMPALIVWTTWLKPPTNPPPRYASLIDSGGMETEPTYPVMDSSAAVIGERIMAWRFDNYPRRASSFHIRFHDRPPPYQPAPLGSLRVRNPSPTNTPPSGGREAPASPSSDSEVSLLTLDVGGKIPLFRKPSHSGLTPWTEAVFEVREDNRRSTNWTVRELQVRSTSGNFARVNPLFVRAQSGKIETGFTAAWWREEPDWILTAILGRIGSFGETNLLSIPALPAKGLNTSLTTNFTSRFLAPPGGKLSLQPASLTSSSGPALGRTTDLELTYTPDNRHRRLELVRVTDQSGEDLGFSKQSDNGHGRFIAGLELRPTSKSVNLTFAISEVRTVEFLVKPRFIGAGPAAHGLP